MVRSSLVLTLRGLLLSPHQDDEATVTTKDNDQCQHLGLASYLLWCHILVHSGLWLMPKSTQCRQLSDKLSFIGMTLPCHLIIFHELFPAWELFLPRTWSHNLSFYSFSRKKDTSKTLVCVASKWLLLEKPKEMSLRLGVCNNFSCQSSCTLLRIIFTGLLSVE